MKILLNKDVIKVIFEYELNIILVEIIWIILIKVVCW